jgi:hypothetical protein
MAAPHRRCGLGTPREASEASSYGRFSHAKLYEPINAGRIEQRDSRTFIDLDSIDVMYAAVLTKIVPTEKPGL